ncbi:MAG: noncanonical pyrimidine nucleotidase, YjjG family [Ruminococcaceae bacterium]|nr:noncanonical pyrimidine nucleotidase, YjjG family [Oscillospiraceae bacterium]
MRYKALLFDLDNTLLDFNKTEYHAIIQTLKKHCLPASDEIAVTYSKINKSFWEAFERGEIKREEIFENRFIKLFETIGVKAESSAFAKDYFDFLACGHETVDGAKEILEWSVSKGIKVYAITNGVAYTQYKRIKESGLNRFFSGIFISEEVGFKKPEKPYFDYVLNHIESFLKNEILIVGDSMSSDILGGKNSGIDTCWYNPYNNSAQYKPTFEIDKLIQIKDILK